MKCFMMLSILLLALGGVINAQVIKTKKAEIDKTPVTSSVAKKTDKVTPRRNTRPLLVDKTVVFDRHKFQVSKNVETRNK